MRIAGLLGRRPVAPQLSTLASRTLLNRNLEIDVPRDCYDRQIKLHINVLLMKMFLFLHLSTGAPCLSRQDSLRTCLIKHKSIYIQTPRVLYTLINQFFLELGDDDIRKNNSLNQNVSATVGRQPSKNLCKYVNNQILLNLLRSSCLFFININKVKSFASSSERQFMQNLIIFKESFNIVTVFQILGLLYLHCIDSLELFDNNKTNMRGIQGVTTYCFYVGPIWNAVQFDSP